MTMQLFEALIFPAHLYIKLCAWLCGVEVFSGHIDISEGDIGD